MTDVRVFVAILADEVEKLRDQVGHAALPTQLDSARHIQHTAAQLCDTLILNAIDSGDAT